ncbi:cobalt-zinc-cadmium efflux system protein [Thiogranum longum]|uniref:Cobalt-zinc-cadmium efflux system protein n=1 Tax=Thiogranum longum TaxID=1537524 RepID=A0A4R1HCL6_9GAMM|nr:cation diffusion facilitator family transporter [Thiogranum longum]TCK17950.1 cobalt-zinc-cadmium efflux system protein [Thiogranum longum]
MSHDHVHQHDIESMGDRRLLLAIIANMLLTVAQVVGGIVSGSLSLVADALHNFSDASSLLIAWLARRIGRQPADDLRTFGYRRAEVIAALVNLVSLVIIGIYLLYEAVWRIFQPQVIEGWIVVIVAGVALVVDVATAILTWTMSKNSMNIRAAFLHNVSDALASVGVVIAGTLILLYGWYWTDTLLTLVIAAYVLYQAFGMLPQTIHLLMEGTPEGVSIADVRAAMEAVEGVRNVHHIHLWQIDEHRSALEAHIVIDRFEDTARIKAALKDRLGDMFDITHSTLEFEIENCGDGS